MVDLKVWFKKFLEGLRQFITIEPPYWTFLYISVVLVTISLLNQHFFKETWAFFLYSAIGTLWRHANKDLPWKDDSIRRIVYHIVNLGLILGLFRYLGYVKF